MKDIEFTVPPELQADIKCFWALEEPQHIFNSDNVTPDSYVELVFNCGAPIALEAEDGTWTELPRVVVNGLQKEPLKLRTTGECQFVCVRLYAWSARRILGVPVETDEQRMIPLSGEWDKIGEAVEVATRHYGYKSAIARLEEFISERLQTGLPDVTPIRSAGEMVYEARGQLSVMDLAPLCYLSPSQFERRFKTATGVSPKTFARLVRYEAIRNLLVVNPSHNLTNLSQDFGYTDQAHFIHDFKTFSTYTPSAFVAAVREGHYRTNLPTQA